MELVRRLDRTRFEPLVISLHADAPLKPAFEDADCRVILLNREKQGRIRTLIEIYQFFDLYRPDIIHSFDYANRAAILGSRFGRKIKIIVSIRSDPEMTLSPIDRAINSFADLVVLNHTTGMEILKRYWPDLPCHVIYNGIDVKTFDANKIPARRFLKGECKNIVGIVARLVPPKDLETLLDAFKRVLEFLPSAQLWLIGDGPLRGKLEARASQLGVNGSVVFLGVRNDIPALLSQCDIGVLSSCYEGLPNAILEYMAAGLPVIATRVGGIPDVVLDGETGLIVPPGDSGALSGALLSLLKDPLTAQGMGMAGRKRVEHYFTVERMVQENENLYLILCNE